MSIDTTFLRCCIGTLERASEGVFAHPTTDEFHNEVFRSACVKEFELGLEQSGKLLRKRLADFFSSNRQVDRLTFKDVFRHAVRHQLIDADTAERWIAYRDNRNNTAHDYGEGFAEATLNLLPAFIADAKALADMIDAGAE